MYRTVTIATLLLFAIGLVQVQAQDKDKEKDKPKRTEAETKALEKIRKHGGLAMELAQNDNRLEVSYAMSSEKWTDDQLAPLKDLKELVHLNLRGTGVTDTQLAVLKSLTSLTRLHLERT